MWIDVSTFGHVGRKKTLFCRGGSNLNLQRLVDGRPISYPESTSSLVSYWETHAFDERSDHRRTIRTVRGSVTSRHAIAGFHVTS